MVHAKASQHGQCTLRPVLQKRQQVEVGIKQSSDKKQLQLASWSSTCPDPSAWLVHTLAGAAEGGKGGGISMQMMRDAVVSEARAAEHGRFMLWPLLR